MPFIGIPFSNDLRQIQKSLYRKSVGFYFKPVTLQYKTQQ